MEALPEISRRKKDDQLAGGDAIRVHNLEKRFGDFVAVNRVSFQVRKGEIFGFLGANGSGKSTTIRMLCGILAPTAGEGTVAGYDLFREPEAIKGAIGYMSQKFSLYEDLTPLENIKFYLGIYNVAPPRWAERIDRIMEMTQLGDVRHRLTRDLPPGWRQRLALGCALLHEPDILFLDEPTSGVDPLTRQRFWSFIRTLAARGITAFVTTHYMDEARYCERIVMLNQGTIVAAGSPGEIVARACPDRREADLNDAFITLMRN